jgi:hypothetical protein
MTKALVIIEVDFDTFGIPVQEGLGESSNADHPGQRRIKEAKRDYIWDSVSKLLANIPEVKNVVKVSIPKEASK